MCKTNEPSCAVGVTIHCTRPEDGLLDKAHPQRIDPDCWRPLIMSSRPFSGHAAISHSSRLGLGPEEMYAPWRGRVQ